MNRSETEAERKDREIMEKIYKLDIYKVVDGTDNWPVIDTIEGDTPEACIEKAELEYGSNGEHYHWTNPY